MIRHMRKIEFNMESINEVCNTLVESLKEMYPELDKNRENIIGQIVKEKNKFMNTLEKGEKEFFKIAKKLEQENSNLIDGKSLFRLYDTFGFPPEVTAELAKENNLKVDMKNIKKNHVKI